MLLTEEIANFQKEMIPQMPEDVLKAFMEATERLVKSGIAERALNVGDALPDFTLPNTRGEAVSSRDLLKSGPLVINFYRGGWCPYCNLELNALQKALPQIQALGAQLVAITPELPDKSLSTTEKNSLTFEVLSDKGNAVSKTFGLVFTLAEKLRPLYSNLGIDIPEFNGDESFELAMPATYVVDTKGTITLAFVDADYTKRLEPAEVIEALNKIQPKQSAAQ